MSEVIKEFLASIKWQSDESSKKKFDNSLKTATQSAQKLGKDLIIAAGAVEILGQKMADEFNSIYFASKRTGASSREIGTLENAFKNLGGTAGDARSAIEAVASFQKRYPGGGKFLTSALGVSPEHLGDAAKSVEDISRALQNMPTSLQYQYGSVLGLSEEQINAIANPDFINNLQAASTIFKDLGVNQDEASAKGRELSKTFNDIESTLSVVGANFFNAFEPALKWFEDTFVSRMAKGAVKLMNTFGRSFTNIFEFLGAYSAERNQGGIEHLHKANEMLTQFMGGTYDFGPQTDYTNPKPDSLPLIGTTNQKLSGQLSKLGLSDEQVRGILYRLNIESGMRAGAHNEIGGGHYGLAQWGKARQADFAEMFGHSIQQGTEDEQVKFLASELSGKYSNVLGKLKGAKSGAEAYDIFTRGYEVPGDNAHERMLAMGAQKNLAPTITQTTTIQVNGTDHPQTVANNVTKQQGNVNAGLVRNLSPGVK